MKKEKRVTTILNGLTKVTLQSNLQRVTTIIAGLLLVCGVLFAVMVGRIPKKVALFIDSLQFLNTTELTIGESSDLAFAHVPNDYITVRHTAEGWHWEVNPMAKDSLQYYKVNGRNPNRYAIADDETQIVKLAVPHGKDTLRLSLSGADIWHEWKGFSKQKDVLARHFAVRHAKQQESVIADESEAINQKACRSFFHKDNDGISLIILDKLTKVNDEGYCYQGDLPASSPFKIQFFNISDHCYSDGEDNGFFQIDGVNYVMKATVKLTEWGAGHLMIKRNEGTKGFDVFFPKAIGFVGTRDSLLHKAEETSNVISFKQSSLAFPTKSDLYYPLFSNAISSDICNLELHEDGQPDLVRDNMNNTIEVHPAKTWKLPFSLVPAFERITLKSGNATIKARIGYIDFCFILSYLWLPFLTLLALMIFIAGPWSPVIIIRRQGDNLYNKYQVQNHPRLLIFLLLIAFCYCICKSLIALKLSYTFPYFEKLTGIIPISTSMMLLLFFTLAMIVNLPITRATSRINFPLKSILFVGALFVTLVGAFIYVLDPAVNASVISSYLPSEIRPNLLIWSWLDKAGINDTHRSVPYALFVIETLALILWTLGAALWPFFAKRTRKTQGWEKKADAWRVKIENLWNSYDQRFRQALQKRLPREIKVKKAELQCEDPENKFSLPKYLGEMLGRLPFVTLGLIAVIILGVIADSTIVTVLGIVLMLALLAFRMLFNAFRAAIVALFPSHFLLLLLLIIIGKSFGNFGTAFITFGVIIGLSQALSSVKFDIFETEEQEGLQPLEVLWEMLFITLLYTGGAMWADNGYMTNFIGFVLACLCFYFLIDRKNYYGSLAARKEKQERKRIRIYLCTLAVLIIFLPRICSYVFSPDDVNYSRLSRRVMLYSNFENLQQSGYRYSESDAEFMVIMSHYMQQKKVGDPLSNDDHFMHASISTGQSPVVLNDLSVPVAFIGSYGRYATTAVYFILLLSLLMLVIQFSLSFTGKETREPRLTHAMQWRLLAVFMWAGTSFYIYFSYLDALPFTGRLNPGFGVDAVGESLETALLLAFMAAVTYKRPEEERGTPKSRPSALEPAALEPTTLEPAKLNDPVPNLLDEFAKEEAGSVPPETKPSTPNLLDEFEKEANQQ